MSDVNSLRLQALFICDAYESGYGKGLNNENLPNPYPPETGPWYGYDFGFKNGKERFDMERKQFFDKLRG
jgi:hypothetical protein